MRTTIAARCRLVLILAGGLLVAVNAAAQTIGATTGALNGRVTDKTGAVLPGVAVVASSPAMLGSRPALTDATRTLRAPGGAAG